MTNFELVTDPPLSQASVFANLPEEKIAVAAEQSDRQAATA